MARGIAGAGPLADHLRNVSEFNAGKSNPVRSQFRALRKLLLSDFHARIALRLPGTCGRDPWRRPMLVLLCRVPHPKPALPSRGTLPQKRLRLISNLPLLYAHVLCCFVIYPAPPHWPAFPVVICFLLALVISS